jgi:hypothetical protein
MPFTAAPVPSGRRQEPAQGHPQSSVMRPASRYQAIVIALGGATGAQLSGTVTRAEYDSSIHPQIDAAVAGGRPIRYLV